MPSIRLLFLWHMHQPYYKDLVTGQYRLPWVRLHALKDYYGMVKLLDEFPEIHQTFNLVPSLIAQIQDYVSGAAHDPFLEVASHSACDLDFSEKLFALQYLFQANVENMIGRYPRYRELWQQYCGKHEEMARLVPRLTNAELTDLQVLSQIAWMDEFFLDDPDIRGLIKKGRGFTAEDQQLVIRKETEFLARVLPAYTSAAQRGLIEISTSPFYHPILPLVCDTTTGAASHHGVPLPNAQFQHSEDAREQIVRGLDLHQKVFGKRPAGMWPSEGSVSDEVLGLAANAGLNWLATDEGVLGRSIGCLFERDGQGHLRPDGADSLYRIYRWQQKDAAIHVLFRDHSLSDLIGFVYSGVPPRDAAADFIRKVKESAAPVLASGRDAVVPVILDGENAWETYPQSGREFLQRLYDGIQSDKSFESLTFSEAIAREQSPTPLKSVIPGSWINANFDVWIGAPEDNLAWDHLSAAHDFYSERKNKVPAPQRQLAYEELLIAEGSDWNWWYGPEHHTQNDRDFDELYRKHLANVYHALGSHPPDALAQPITGFYARPQFTPQTAYIHPQIDGSNIGYFDWLGAASHIADRHTSSMHGKLFLLDTGYAGIDEKNLYCRLDFMESAAEFVQPNTKLVVSIEAAGESLATTHAFRLEADISSGRIDGFQFGESGDGNAPHPGVLARMESIFECQIPLELLGAAANQVLRIRFAIWRDRLPLDALPSEGALEVRIVPEDELGALPYAKP